MTELYVISGPPFSGKMKTIEEMKKIKRKDSIFFMKDACKYTYKKYDDYEKALFNEENQRVRHVLYSNQLLLENSVPEEAKFAIINKSCADYAAYDALHYFETPEIIDYMHKEIRAKQGKDYKKIFLVSPKLEHKASYLFLEKIIEFYLRMGYKKNLVFINEKNPEKRAFIIYENIFDKCLVKI